MRVSEALHIEARVDRIRVIICSTLGHILDKKTSMSDEGLPIQIVHD